jgi:uncharacterized membrane protein
MIKGYLNAKIRLLKIILIFLFMHALIVHFPIGLLTVYSLIEFLRFKKILDLPYLFYTKAILLIVGTLSAFAATGTGELAGEFFENNVTQISNFVEVHSIFAGITTTIFTILAVAYVYEWIRKENKFIFIQKIIFLPQLVRIIMIFSPLIAFAGLVSITITGALGASIVYGPNVDIFARFIYSLFF